MTTIHQAKINKIIAQLEELWQLLPNTTNDEQVTRQQLRAKIEKLTQQEIKDLEALGVSGDTHLQEKSEWLNQKANLEKELRETKEAFLSEKKKLGEELVKKLEALAKGTSNETKLAELKSLLTDVKDSKSEIKLSGQELKELQPTNYWSIGGCVLAAITVFTSVTIYLKLYEQHECK